MTDTQIVGAVVAGSFLMITGAGIYGALRMVDERRRSTDDPVIEGLIAQHGVRWDGTGRRPVYRGYDPKLQKAATRRRITQLQESVGDGPLSRVQALPTVRLTRPA